MSGCDFDTLEALAFDELTPSLAEEARSHVAGCPACARELELLRAERGLFAARAGVSPPLPSFSAALARSRWSSPVIVAAKASPKARPSRFPWAVSAFGVAAAAAFAGLFLVPPGGTTSIEPPSKGPIAVEPATEDFCRDEAFYNGITTAPKTTSVCEMSAQTSVAEETPEPCGSCGSCTHADEVIDPPCDDSPVTNACFPPLPN